MNVVFVINSLNQGGIETYLLRFIQQYNKEINPIIICLKDEYDIVFLNKYKRFANHIFFVSGITKYFRFYKILKKSNSKIICDFRGSFSGTTMFISYLLNYKKRIVFYRESMYQFKNTILKSLYIYFSIKLIIRFSTYVLSNSHAAIDNFFRKSDLINKKIKIIRNGVFSGKRYISSDSILRKNLKIQDSSFVIGHVGRLCEAKNYNTILKIVKSLFYKLDNCYFLFCGRGVKEFFDINITNHNLRSRIITPGHCHDISNYYDTMDCFLFPSLNEGQPNTLIEAMLHSKPIISSDIDSIKETVHESMKSYLFNPIKDSEFTNAILDIFDNGCNYNVSNVRDWAEHKYSQQKRFLDFYDILNER